MTNNSEDKTKQVSSDIVKNALVDKEGLQMEGSRNGEVINEDKSNNFVVG